MTYLIISFSLGFLSALALAWHFVKELKAGGDKTLVKELHTMRKENWDLQTELHWMKIANQTMFDDGIEFERTKPIREVVSEMIKDHKKLKIFKTEKGHPQMSQIKKLIQEKNMKTITNKQIVGGVV